MFCKTLPLNIFCKLNTIIVSFLALWRVRRQRLLV
jgi:hypothetical protein